MLFLQPRLDQNGDWPWSGETERGSCDPRFRYSLTTLTIPRRCVGLARRRVGRGGRWVKSVSFWLADLNCTSYLHIYIESVPQVSSGPSLFGFKWIIPKSGLRFRVRLLLPCFPSPCGNHFPDHYLIFITGLILFFLSYHVFRPEADPPKYQSVPLEALQTTDTNQPIRCRGCAVTETI